MSDRWQTHCNRTPKSIPNIGLQGLALKRDNAGPFEKVLTSCRSMKNYEKQGRATTMCLFQCLKEVHWASLQNLIKIAELSFEQLDLKGKRFNIFQPNRDASVLIDALSLIEPKITADSEVPHKRASLSEYPGLEQFLEKHLTKGLLYGLRSKIQRSIMLQNQVSPCLHIYPLW